MKPSRKKTPNTREVRFVHGTLIAHHGRGLLLMGRPGIGKSRHALRLIERGCSLVADDLVRLEWSKEKKWIGSCPDPTRGVLAIADVKGRSVLLKLGSGLLLTEVPIACVLVLRDFSDLIPRSSAV